MAYSPADLAANKQAGLRSVMPGIENAFAFGTDLANVAHFRRRGVVYATLCHNGNNDICDSARPNKADLAQHPDRGGAEHGGLSEFGRSVVREMNRVGMMVDLSHGAETSFYDALEVSALPIVCSHSSARALCNHPRNLTDDQLRALAAAGGVAQCTFYAGFLRTDDANATVDDALRHLLHMISVAGIDHVGIGTDFDGDGGVPGLANASELIQLTRRLQAEGFTDEDLAKIWGGNFLRVMTRVQAAAQS
jgi:glutamine amidotransferase, class II/dipeptidase